MINTYIQKDINTIQEQFKTECKKLHKSKLQEIFSINDNESDFEFKKIETSQDLDELSNTQGLYIIFTNCKLDDNSCELAFNFPNDSFVSKAIYRGQGTNVKDRLISHLFNTQYKNSDKPEMKNCIKIELGESGIDIDSSKYKGFSWYVSVVRLSKSNAIVRQYLEETFDELYGRPFASREKSCHNKQFKSDS